jgi:Zn-dependent protease
VLLAEPDRTPYDFHFELLGFSVRVTPFFWVAAAVLGYSLANSYGALPVPNNPGKGVFLLVWMATMFLSILVHEMGHTFAFRHYGIPSSIVLYHFGGLAIPDSFSSFTRLSSSRTRENQIMISAAGPGAQLLLAAVVIGVVQLSGHQLRFEIWPLQYLLPPSEKPPFSSLVLDAVLFCLAGPSIYWALLNLLPIFPLDGGQIARELFVRFGSGNAMRDSLSLSMFTAIACAVYSYTTGETFLVMFFASLAVSSYQMLQMFRFGGGSW